MDENGYSQAETMLIKEIFEEHGKYLRNELRKKISKLRLNRSNNLSFSVDFNIVAENSFPKLEMEFADYVPFIEIRWHNITRNRKALFPQKTETAAEPRNVCSPLHQAGLKGAAHHNKFSCGVLHLSGKELGIFFLQIPIAIGISGMHLPRKGCF